MYYKNKSYGVIQNVVRTDDTKMSKAAIVTVMKFDWLFIDYILFIIAIYHKYTLLYFLLYLMCIISLNKNILFLKQNLFIKLNFGTIGLWQLKLWVTTSLNVGFFLRLIDRVHRGRRETHRRVVGVLDSVDRFGRDRYRFESGLSLSWLHCNLGQVT